MADKASIFRTGLCDAMAIALYEKTGLPFGIWRAFLETDPDFDEPEDQPYEDIHAVVIVDANTCTYLDVDGLHEGIPENLVASEPSRVRFFELVEVSESELRMAFSSFEDSMEEGIRLAKNFIEESANLSSLIEEINSGNRKTHP